MALNESHISLELDKEEVNSDVSTVVASENEDYDVETDLFDDVVPGKKTKRRCSTETVATVELHVDPDQMPPPRRPQVSDEKVVVVKDKTLTRAQLKHLLNSLPKADEEDEDDILGEDFSQRYAVMPRSSMDDFQLPEDKAPRESRFQGKTNAEWCEELHNMRMYLTKDILPFEIRTGSRHAKNNFKKRANKRFRMIDGQLRYYHKRSRDDRGEIEAQTFCRSEKMHLKTANFMSITLCRSLSVGHLTIMLSVGHFLSDTFAND